MVQATRRLNALVERAQEMLTDYLIPDGTDAHTTLSNLLGLLDGTEQREIQGHARALLSKIGA